MIYFPLLQLLSTADEVAKLQQELETMRPLLEEAVKEAETTMVQISKDTIVAEQTKSVVQKEENEAAEKARETQAIADDAQRDLNEALPALVCYLDYCNISIAYSSSLLLLISILSLNVGCSFSQLEIFEQD